MTESYFDELLELAARIVSLADVENTLSGREWKNAKKQHDSLETRFAEVSKKYIDALLSAPNGRDGAYDLVAADIAAIRNTCDASWTPAVDYVSDTFLPRLSKETARDPRLRTAIKAVPWIVGGTALIGYFAVRLLSATPIDHASDTREGIQERAAAVEKVLRYDDWMDTRVRRGGWVKGVLLWPIEPTEAETKGASEFAGLAYQAQELTVQQFNCPAMPRGYDNFPSKAELAYLSRTAKHLRRSNTPWKTPPVATVVDAARAIGKC